MEKRRLYMDYSATTPAKKEVVEDYDAILILNYFWECIKFPLIR